MIPPTSVIAESLQPQLSRAFANDSRVKVRLGTHDDFRRFRALEMKLVSVLDHDAASDDRAACYVVASVDGDDAALASFVVESNARRPEGNNVYGRVDLVMGIGYGDDIGKAREVLEKVVKNHPMVLADPAPTIEVHELGDSSVNFIVRPWSKTEDYWAVYWALQRKVKEEFDANDISIPFPQRDVHLIGQVAQAGA